MTTRAERIANDMEARRAFARWVSATPAEVAEFAALVADVEAETGFHGIRPNDFWGLTRAEMVAKVAMIQARSKRRAGSKALAAKYGKSGAESIIAGKTGRSVTLQG